MASSLLPSLESPILGPDGEELKVPASMSCGRASWNGCSVPTKLWTTTDPADILTATAETLMQELPSQAASEFMTCRNHWPNRGVSLSTLPSFGVMCYAEIENYNSHPKQYPQGAPESSTDLQYICLAIAYCSFKMRHNVTSSVSPWASGADLGFPMAPRILFSVGENLSFSICFIVLKHVFQPRYTKIPGSHRYSH